MANDGEQRGVGGRRRWEGEDKLAKVIKASHGRHKTGRKEREKGKREQNREATPNSPVEAKKPKPKPKEDGSHNVVTPKASPANTPLRRRRPLRISVPAAAENLGGCC